MAFGEVQKRAHRALFPPLLSRRRASAGFEPERPAQSADDEDAGAMVPPPLCGSLEYPRFSGECRGWMEEATLRGQASLTMPGGHHGRVAGSNHLLITGRPMRCATRNMRRVIALELLSGRRGRFLRCSESTRAPVVGARRLRKRQGQPRGPPATRPAPS